MTDSSNFSATAQLSPDALKWDDPTVELVRQIVIAADERKGDNISLLKVEGISTLADYFVIITGFSRVQVRAIAGAIADQVEEHLQRNPRRVEGGMESSWVLIDYIDVVVHIQMPSEREFYNLEAFWGHAERIDPALFLA